MTIAQRSRTRTRPTSQLDPYRAPDWTDDAACADWQGWPFDPWHPKTRTPAGERYDFRTDDPWKVGRDICDACPVKMTCVIEKLDVEVGLPLSLRFGLCWLTPRERWTVEQSKQPRPIAIRDVLAARVKKTAPKPPKPTVCAHCGIDITQPRYGVRVYCTPLCSNRARRLKFVAAATARKAAS
ncbi:MAG: hypothetical protein M0Z51_16605 [Propionibacterium sp.]|nr:hypothetical protein [Propionibacterium sp.]